MAQIKEEDDDLGTTRAVASYNSNERGSISQVLSTPGDDGDDELTEVFEHGNEMDDTVVDTRDNVLLSTSPQYQRSCSVGAGAVGSGGQSSGELRKRFRNWSGTQSGSDVGFSPRGSRRTKHRSPTPIDDETMLCMDCANRQGKGTNLPTLPTDFNLPLCR